MSTGYVGLGVRTDCVRSGVMRLGVGLCVRMGVRTGCVRIGCVGLGV